VIENITGKVLQSRSGDLLRKLGPGPEVYASGYDFIAFVGPRPAGPKEYALEFGGKGAYVIPVGLKGFLANEEDDFFSKADVVHPPSKEYRYLREARDEVEEFLPGDLVISIKQSMVG